MSHTYQCQYCGKDFPDSARSQCECANGSPAPSCSAPLGESGEEYYCKRDDFVRYIEDEVNPARENSGLIPLDLKSAEEAYRILNDFYRKQNQKGQRP